MAQDSDSAVEFHPTNVPEEYLDRLDDLTDELVEYPGELNREVAIKEEIQAMESRLEKIDAPEDGLVRYLATLEVLLDLVEIDYGIRKNSKTRVVRPDLEALREKPQEYKERERSILDKERQMQFQEDSVKRFIREMEDTHPSVRNLIVDGDELHADLAPLQDQSRDEIIASLDDQIQPYIQVVEKGVDDEHTGLDLMDIWRYFRYSWLTPYNTVPGRNINFLIRDAAREHHPVMGIASLASSMMNLAVRDDHIGWTYEAVKDRLEKQTKTVEYEEQLPADERTPDRKTRTKTNTIELETEDEYQARKQQFCTKLRTALSQTIDSAVDNIRVDDFQAAYPQLTEDRLLDPDDEVFDILTEIEEDAREIIEDPSIDDSDPDRLESWEERSETPLFRRKRAETLQRLLRDRRYFIDNGDEGDVKFIETAMETKVGKRAIKTALKEIKKRRAGAAMMNIMVCGAIPPYNAILGGKLVAMALTGPKVIQAYQNKYAGATSKIASSMKGEPVQKQSELVFLDTTSLFEVGSAQYERVRVPTDRGKIEYRELGTTKGYGSIQFGPKTRIRLSEVTELEEGRQHVRGRFGEGVAPRMRKIRRGLENCGLDGELLRHESKRIVYGVDLATNFDDYLLGATDNPEYYWEFNDVEAEQQSIYDHWKQRWVSKRIQKDFVLDRIQEFSADEFLLSNEVTYNQKQLSDFIVEG